eukprot:CAMPEP_0170729956 /NCGR_PEP_ID=MMETSP0437-20130122/285_1 /TAXON_ID=0 /ORGANISM="Sexangularia sp." /LENGTH=109 /DNA_ID=CAMNT_0011068141 /DNA_START=75 /DNA_END=401 /DNA_ORIENTATION=-
MIITTHDLTGRQARRKVDWWKGCWILFLADGRDGAIVAELANLVGPPAVQLCLVVDTTDSTRMCLADTQVDHEVGSGWHNVSIDVSAARQGAQGNTTPTVLCGWFNLVA